MQAKYLKDWEQDMNRCIRCAYCFEGYSVFKDLGWEASFHPSYNQFIPIEHNCSVLIIYSGLEC